MISVETVVPLMLTDPVSRSATGRTSSAVTAIDGYQLARKGAGGRSNPASLTHRLNFMRIFDCDHAFAPIAFRISSLAPSMDWLPLTVCSRPSLA